MAEHFDPTLNRYRLAPNTRLNNCSKTMLELWDTWVGILDLPPANKANHYEAIRQMLVKATPRISDTGWLV